MRFGLLNVPGLHPILATGNDKAEVFFWDLQKLEKTFDGVSSRGVPPHGIIKATRPIKKGKDKDVVRAITWSPGGEWCVASGENGRLLLCSRWGGKSMTTDQVK
jgi:hypothetical protein